MKKITSFFINLVLGILFVLVLSTSPAFPTKYLYYRVKRGDSLIKIAKKYGVSVEELKRLNHLRGNRIYVGQKLKIKPIETKKEAQKTAQAQKTTQIQKTKQVQKPGTLYIRYIYHIVKKGDTLAKIAKKYGVTVWEIKRMNHLRSNKIYVGQRLRIKVAKIKRITSKHKTSKPKKVTKSATTLTKYLYYRVKRGDSLIKIAKKYGVSVEELKRLNHLRGNRIYVGQKLKIKPIETKKEAQKTAQAQKTTQIQKTKQVQKPGTLYIRYIYHIVKKGDTLAKIAKKYGVTVWEIKRMNHLRSNKIYVGQRLLIKKITVFKVQNKVVLPKKSEVEKKFDDLENKYKSCIGNNKCKEKNWLSLIEAYRRLYLLHPDTKVAPKAVLRVAEIYYRLYKNFNESSYLDKSIKKYQFLIKNFPNAPETEIAYAQLIRIYRKDLKNSKKAEELRLSFQRKYLGSTRDSTNFSQTEQVKTLVAKKKNSPKPILNLKKVVDVEPVTGEDYSRIIIDVSGDFQYKTDVLKGDSIHPPRIYVDIYPATLSSAVPREIDIKDSHLEKIRVGQFNRNTVRVVLDLKSLTSYKIFKLKNPYQLILDLTGKEKKPAKGYINLARQLGLGIKSIVIDPGHGGKDSGAIGPDGLKEKDVVLKIAKMVKKFLEKKLHVKVFLTRNSDRFVPLVQRPAIANSKKADLFISIHVNASPDKHARGIETYYLNFTTDPEAMRVAALENAVSNKGLSDLQSLVKAILANTKLSESRFLAEKIQHALVKTLSKVYPDTVDRGVKYAPFLVLVGTRMPAVLVEVSFITNPIEEKRLHSNKYLELIAKGIVQGISDYIQSLKSMKHKFYEEKK